MKLRRLHSGDPDFDRSLAASAMGGGRPSPEIMQAVATILEDVRQRGDDAVLEHTRRLDGLEADSMKQLALSRETLEEAAACIPGEMRDALQAAAERIRGYHARQCLPSWQYEDALGTVFGERVTALDRVGVYVPGGKAAYPSSVLMNVLPARVAGVGEIVMTTPAGGGAPDPSVLAAAHIAGVDRAYTIGGAQAVAALAYGTATIPRVDKIVGPGNVYISAAKLLAFGLVGIDMLAGPSEVLAIADGSADPEWVAADLLAQAEHDEDARATLVTPDAALLDRVEAAIWKLLPHLERAAIIQASLQANGLLVQVRDLDEAAAIANRIAPEHLELAVAEPQALLERIRNAGAIFLGHYSAETLGDYCAGPNHVLPTGGTARFSSPLGVYDFLKRSSFLHCGPDGGGELGRLAARLAHSEGLTAHAHAAELRANRGQKASSPGAKRSPADAG